MLMNMKEMLCVAQKEHFAVPALRQLQILDVNRERNETTAAMYPSGHYRIEDGRLVLSGESFEVTPTFAMPFASDKRLTYKRQDVGFRPESVTEVSPDTFLIKGWDQTTHTAPGERFVLRSRHRPTPGIFVSECTNTTLENIRIRYAEGMGLLAQMSENITLDGFNVCLRSDDDPRFFTTQADATHFSGCKGMIVSKNGLYENMADDAINVHGTSTPLGDVAELKAIEKVFGEHATKVSISSTKSMTGHLLGAAGAIEALACIMAIQKGIIPPTINLEHRDEAINPDLQLTPNVAAKRDVNYALSNTFGFGGHNASVVFKKFN